VIYFTTYRELENQLLEAEETIEAIKNDKIDALVNNY
jgi:hypothetical protein